MKNNKRRLAVDRLGLSWKPKKHSASRFSTVYVDFIKKFKKQNELNDDNN